jgi:hypothetical protein
VSLPPHLNAFEASWFLDAQTSITQSQNDWHISVRYLTDGAADQAKAGYQASQRGRTSSTRGEAGRPCQPRLREEAHVAGRDDLAEHLWFWACTGILLGRGRAEGGPEEGGLEEFCEFWFNRASKAATLATSSTMKWRASKGICRQASSLSSAGRCGSSIHSHYGVLVRTATPQMGGNLTP